MHCAAMIDPSTRRIVGLEPPPGEPVFRFGQFMGRATITLWFDEPDIVWRHDGLPQRLSLLDLRAVRAFRRSTEERTVRMIELKPRAAADGPDGPPFDGTLQISDWRNGLFDRPEPDFEPFARRLAEALRRRRPYLSIDGDESILNPR
jgi:hypothetical protein